MKHMIPLLSFIVLFSTCITKGMEKEVHFPGQLNEIEKLIVWRKIKKIGKPMVLSMIQPTTDNPDKKDESKNLPTVTHIRKNSTDRCDIFIINTINEQEKDYGYVPKQISKKKNGVWHITIPTNYIGNYTRYWHKEDAEGEYIELYSNFTDQQALLEVIHNCNLYFACSS
jgi:hypothetical protein